MSWLRNSILNAGGNSEKARARRNSKRDNRAIKEVVNSGAYDHGRLATLDDLKKAGMLSPTRLGLPIGTKDGEVTFDNSDMPINIYGPPGSQKTMSIGFPCLASWEGSTIIVDIDHQYVRGVRPYRESQGHKSIVLNPHGLYGLESHSYNIFSPVLKAIQNGDMNLAVELARDNAAILVPETPGARNSNEWIDIAARDLQTAAMVFLGMERPNDCNPGGLFEFLSRPPKTVIDELGNHGSTMFILRRALKLIAELGSGAEKQIFWKFEKSAENLTLFEPGTPYERVTRSSDFDAAECKSGDRPVDIYLCFDGTKLESSGAYLSLMLSNLIEDIAGASGDRHTLILADEFSQIPKSRTVVKAIRLYRKRLIRVMTMSQSRQSLADRLGPNLQRDIEAMAGTNIWLSPELAVAQELSAKSGTSTKLTRNMSDDHSVGNSASKSFSEISAPNLHIADLCFEGGEHANQAIVDVKSLPGLLVSEKFGWWDVWPFAEQLSDAYLDDSNRHAPINGGGL